MQIWKRAGKTSLAGGKSCWYTALLPTACPNLFQNKPSTCASISAWDRCMVKAVSFAQKSYFHPTLLPRLRVWVLPAQDCAVPISLLWDSLENGWLYRQNGQKYKLCGMCYGCFLLLIQRVWTIKKTFRTFAGHRRSALKTNEILLNSFLHFLNPSCSLFCTKTNLVVSGAKCVISHEVQRKILNITSNVNM